MSSFFSSDCGLFLSIVTILVGLGMGWLGVLIVQHRLAEEQTNLPKMEREVLSEEEIIAQLNDTLRDGWLQDGKALASDRKRLFGQGLV